MTGGTDRGEGEHLAPVIPLFGGPAPVAPTDAAQPPRSAADVRRELVRRGLEEAASEADSEAVEDTADVERDADAAIAAASDALVKRLRGRSLSEREARMFLTQQDLSPGEVEGVVDEMLHLGYLNDAALAEQLVHAGTTRKGEGRAAIAQTLTRRGIPRDVADAALSETGDDDAERALEFARRKAASVGGRDQEASLRRLVGQLARRGYPSGVAMTAARQALAEAARPQRGPWFD